MSGARDHALRVRYVAGLEHAGVSLRTRVCVCVQF